MPRPPSRTCISPSATAAAPPPLICLKGTAAPQDRTVPWLLPLLLLPGSPSKLLPAPPVATSTNSSTRATIRSPGTQATATSFPTVRQCSPAAGDGNDIGGKIRQQGARLKSLTEPDTTSEAVEARAAPAKGGTSSNAQCCMSMPEIQHTCVPLHCFKAGRPHPHSRPHKCPAVVD